LERLTPAVTRMRVTVDKGSIFKDSATSTEIILQTVQRLENTNRRLESTKKRLENTKRPRHSHTSGRRP